MRRRACGAPLRYRRRLRHSTLRVAAPLRGRSRGTNALREVMVSRRRHGALQPMRHIAPFGPTRPGNGRRRRRAWPVATVSAMFSTLLVANRGEIAIRAFRAAYELGVRTVAVFPWEDRNSVHRIKADEAYQIGERGHPVRAYLDIAEIIRVAREAGADAVYPGYGFLSENPGPGQACAAAGHHLRRAAAGGTGDGREQGRARSRRPGRPAAGAALLGAPRTSTSSWPPPRRSATRCSSRPSPAAAGAGCAGSTDPAELREALEAAMREAGGAFGDATVFLEQAVLRPRHIEVQVLADAAGEPCPPLRAGLLGPAPAPEGRRDRPGAGPRPGVRERLCRTPWRSPGRWAT